MVTVPLDTTPPRGWVDLRCNGLRVRVVGAANENTRGWGPCRTVPYALARTFPRRLSPTYEGGDYGGQRLQQVRTPGTASSGMWSNMGGCMLKNCGILLARCSGPPNGRRSEPRSSLRVILCGNGRRTLLSRPPEGLGPLGRVEVDFDRTLSEGFGARGILTPRSSRVCDGDL